MKIYTIFKSPQLLAKANSIIQNFTSIEKFEQIVDILAVENNESTMFIKELSEEEAKNKAYISDFISKSQKRVIFVSPIPLASEFKVHYIPKEFKIVEFASKFSEFTQSYDETFYAIGQELLLANEHYPCDIYLKLGPKKYVRFAIKEDKVDVLTLEKYLKSGVSHFFIMKNDFENYGDHFFKQDLINLKNFDNKIEGLSKKHKMIQNVINDFGVSKFVLDQIEGSLEVFEDKVRTSNTKALMDMFEKSKGSFVYDHSFLTVFFCGLICENLDWYDDTVREKLVMAAMFHDLAIENPNLALSEDLKMNDLLQLDSKSSIEISNHTKKIAYLLQQNPDIPNDVVNICLNHHEGHEEGYPKGVPFTSLSQLERIFILAHALSLGLYRIAFRLEKFDGIIDDIKRKYSCGNFAGILDNIATRLKANIENP